MNWLAVDEETHAFTERGCSEVGKGVATHRIRKENDIGPSGSDILNRKGRVQAIRGGEVSNS